MLQRIKIATECYYPYFYIFSSGQDVYEKPRNTTKYLTLYAPCIILLLLFVLVMGPISTAAMKAYCTLNPYGVPSFISRGAAHQAA
jgi:hypothetical protein